MDNLAYGVVAHRWSTTGCKYYQMGGIAIHRCVVVVMATVCWQTLKSTSSSDGPNAARLDTGLYIKSSS